MGNLKSPKLRFPEFEGAWENKKLGETFKIFNGFAFPSNVSLGDGCRWVKISDVGIQEMKKDNLSFLPVSYSEKYFKFKLTEGDYVIALTRPILDGKLKIAKIDNFYDGALLNQRVGKIESHHNKSFLYCYLQKEDLIKSIESNIAGSDPPNLSPSEINGLVLCIPTLPEQNKIASFLIAVDEKLQGLKKKKTLLEQYKKGAMQQLFSRQLRFKDDNGQPFPDWEEKKLSEVLVETKLGGNYENSESYDGIPVIKMGNLGRGNINLDKVQFLPLNEKYDDDDVLKDGDLLFNTRNTLELVGKVSLWRGEIDFALYNSNLMRMRFNHQIEKSNRFMNYLFNTRKSVNQLRSFATGTTSVAAIYSRDLKSFILHLPCLMEQTKIANFLSAIDDKINTVQQQIEKTESWKRGLLQQMFV